MNQDVRAAASGTEEERFGWRNTPKINLVPERRTIPISPLAALLVVVLLIEAAVAFVVYTRLQDREAAVDDATVRLEQARQGRRQALQDLDRVRGEAVAVEAEVQAVDVQIEEITKQDAGVTEAYTLLTQKRPDWAVTVQALLRTDGSDFHIYRLAARPPNKVDLSATAAGLGAIRRDFLTYMNSVSDFLDLASWNSEQGENGSAAFDAVVDLK